MNSNNVQPEGNYYDKYSSTNWIEKKLVNNFFENLCKLLIDIKYNNVYELGCGEGHGSNIIYNLKKVDEYIATDISINKITEATEKFSQINFKQDSIYNIDKKSDSVDLVVACEVLEHVDNFEIAIQELFRVSRKYVIVSVPNEPIWRFCNMLRGKYITDGGNTPGHMNHWNKRRLRHLLGKYGDVIDVKMPFPWIIMLCKKI